MFQERPARADFRSNNIGRITTAGTITQYAVPTPDSGTQGPDGAIWFTEYEASKIGRIDAAGHIQLFRITPLPRPSPRARMARFGSAIPRPITWGELLPVA